MKVKKFDRQLLASIIYNDAVATDTCKLSVVAVNDYGSDNSNDYSELIFKDELDSKLYKAEYYTDNRPYVKFDYFEGTDEDGMVECFEVEPVEITTVQYKLVS